MISKVTYLNVLFFPKCSAKLSKKTNPGSEELMIEPKKPRALTYTEMMNGGRQRLEEAEQGRQRDLRDLPAPDKTKEERGQAGQTKSATAPTDPVITTLASYG